MNRVFYTFTLACFFILTTEVLSGCRKSVSAPTLCPEPIPRANPIPSIPSGKSFRVFALGVTIDFSTLTNRETFRAVFLKEIESLRPCFDRGGANLIVYPEDVGLLAALVGPRGELARGVTRSEDAFISLALAYSSAMGYYLRKFPWITQNQALTLALSNTVWGLALETFGDVARSVQSPVVVSLNAPYPFAVTPEDAAPPPLTYPELGIPYVYEAVTSQVFNLSVFFSPSGELLGVDPKRYLVPVEEDLLQLAYGDLGKISLFSIGGIAVGSVISKDAWMPDVLERLSDIGAQFLVQPEAFSGWTISETSEEEWLPDVFMESGYLATQLYPGFDGVAVPMLIGNFFDLVFDGQSHLTQKISTQDPLLSFVGNPPTRGFLSLGPWSFPDPSEANPELSLSQRRKILRDLGMKLLPFSGDIRSGAYKNSRALGEYSLGESEGVMIRHPQAIALDDGRIFVVYDQFTGGRSAVRYGILNREGSFSEGGVISLGDWALRPVLARRTSEISVLFMQGDPGKEQLVEVIFPLNTLVPTSPQAIAPGPAYQWWPQVTSTDDTLYLAWVDGREQFSGIYFARKRANLWEIPRRVDGKVPGTLRGPRGNSFAPSIAAHGGRVAIAFSDFRNYSWDVYLVFSRDAGETFTHPVLVNDTAPSNLERIVRWTTLDFIPETPPYLKILWNEIRSRKPDPDLYSRSTTDGINFTPETLLPSEPRVIEGRATLKILSSEETLVAWEEVSSNGFRIRILREKGGASSEKELISPRGGPLYFPVLLNTPEGIRVLYTYRNEKGAFELGSTLVSF